MHLVIIAHLCLLLMVCHLSKTFPLKEFKRDPLNRLFYSLHHQTIPSLTFDPWLTALVLVGYKWWCLGLMRALLPYESITCLVFPSLPLPAGLSSPTMCSIACLTLYGVDELLGPHYLHLVSFLGWVLLGYGLFFL